jgi:hypothetical protein
MLAREYLAATSAEPSEGAKWESGYKKLHDTEVESSCLFGPNGDLYFVSITDAGYAASECNEAYAQGRAARQKEQEKVKRLEEALRKIDACCCATEKHSSVGDFPKCPKFIAEQALSSPSVPSQDQGKQL